MTFHTAEINRSFAGDSGQQLKGSLLADSSLSDFNVARTAMTSQAVPGAFGDLAIDFGSGNQPGSLVQMAAAESGIVIDAPRVIINLPPQGPGTDCGKSTVTPNPNGGMDTVITPGPKGCDIGPFTYKGTKDGKIKVEPIPEGDE